MLQNMANTSRSLSMKLLMSALKAGIYCLWYVSGETLEIHEDFSGPYETGNTTAKTLTLLIKDAMCRLGLDLSDRCGQAYDDAANMSGCLSGVQAKALYIHCFCHSLN